MSEVQLEDLITHTRDRIQGTEISINKSSSPFVTISRTCGAGGSALAKILSDRIVTHPRMQQKSWQIFDREMRDSFIADEQLKRRIDQLFPGHYNNQVQEIVAELFTKNKPQDLVLFQLSQLIRKIATAGNAIFVGHGASVATQGLAGGFHVHLVAPLEQRINRISLQRNLNQAEAEKFIQKQDSSYARMMKEHFHVDVQNSLAFDAIFNTGKLSLEKVADLVIAGIN